VSNNGWPALMAVGTFVHPSMLLSIVLLLHCVLKKQATFIFWKASWKIGRFYEEETWLKRPWFCPPFYLNTVATLPCEMQKP